MTSSFKPALIVVDVQEDFCPPNGSLAVPSGREIIPTINQLLDLPFTLKIATKDWHPPKHISFSSTHPNTQPFTSFTTITHPTNSSLTYRTRLWPDHCIQNTPGSSLLSTLSTPKIDKIIEKGKRKDVEMYGAFYDPLRLDDSGLAGVLREKGITSVFVVGLAADYCVKCTAEDAKGEGWDTYVVEEGTRAVDGEEWEKKVRGELEGRGVKIVGFEGEEVGWVTELAGS